MTITDDKHFVKTFGERMKASSILIRTMTMDRPESIDEEMWFGLEKALKHIINEMDDAMEAYADKRLKDCGNA
jgi:hypothetical protein